MTLLRKPSTCFASEAWPCGITAADSPLRATSQTMLRSSSTWNCSTASPAPSERCSSASDTRSCASVSLARSRIESSSWREREASESVHAAS